MTWKPGTQIIQYEMWGRGIGAARPVTVVRDTPSHIALYSHPETQIVTRGIENRGALSLSERIDLYLRSRDPSVGKFRDAISSDNHVLTVTRPNSWHSVVVVLVFRLEVQVLVRQFPISVTPYATWRRVSRFCTRHCVQPDMSWGWKDVDEFEELIAREFFTSKQESSIQVEADKMVATIESRGQPFCDGWENWRPDLGWPAPPLPEDWSETA